MNTGKIREYKIGVGVDCPYIDELDDVFEITLPISDDEVQAIVDGAVRIFWVRNPIAPWEDIEAWAPEAYKKGNAIAEAYCISKWGEDMKVENGAHYEFFLPDEIEDAIWNNEAFQHEKKIRLRLQEESHKQFHEDGKLLYKAYESGRRRRPVGRVLLVWDNAGRYRGVKNRCTDRSDYRPAEDQVLIQSLRV